MSKYYALYNPNANSGKGEKNARRLDRLNLGKEIEYCDVASLEDYAGFIESIPDEDDIILCGGDGTLNFFVNHVDVDGLKNNIYIFACGTGNDFLNDVDKNHVDGIIQINKYLTNLPTVEVKGQTYKFINNVGFGIDGYCCEVADKKRAKSNKKVNYTAIALGGLLGGYKPCTATVTVDGVTEMYDHAWMAPTMNGRFYGGGVMATPNQDRLNPNHKVSVMIYHCNNLITSLRLFTLVIKGKHVSHTNEVRIIEGNHVHVSYDKPCAIQIDGETILDVSEYTVTTCK